MLRTPRRSLLQQRTLPGLLGPWNLSSSREPGQSKDEKEKLGPQFHCFYEEPLPPPQASRASAAVAASPGLASTAPASASATAVSWATLAARNVIVIFPQRSAGIAFSTRVPQKETPPKRACSTHPMTNHQSCINDLRETGMKPIPVSARTREITLAGTCRLESAPRLQRTRLEVRTSFAAWPALVVPERLSQGGQIRTSTLARWRGQRARVPPSR